jgi:hypothetical protein
MKSLFSLTAVIFVATLFALSSCSVQNEKPAKPAASAAAAPAAKAEASAKAAPAQKAQKAPQKAKATKVAGDVGLLDLEKNYLILVTKQGKLITVDFDSKSKVTQITPTPAKITDIGLGASAVVTYQKSGEKNVATSVEYKPAKGGD